ncbi:hypothetical protein HYQ46_005043 [Verticillium longisporum]|nr:hypothetical protein HYQ44_006554 [Verticillium longisporum]KAG7146166.1 hypothetical protein HYQ46_005043 [Verticillium longisporum]
MAMLVEDACVTLCPEFNLRASTTAAQSAAATSQHILSAEQQGEHRYHVPVLRSCIRLQAPYLYIRALLSPG